jgi:hypothetical protein
MSGISDILVKLMFTFCASSLDISEIVVVCNYLMRNIETWQIWEELP